MTHAIVFWAGVLLGAIAMATITPAVISKWERFRGPR
jgi:hypothetical protein